MIGNIARQSLKLRHRLLRYIYSAYLQSADSGVPVQQPLVLAFQEDATLRDIDDQYFFVSQLRVATLSGRSKDKEISLQPKNNSHRGQAHVSAHGVS